DRRRTREMFDAECRKRRSVQQWPEQNELVKPPRPLPIAMKKTLDQPDCQNHPTNRIRPNHLARSGHETLLPLTAAPSTQCARRHASRPLRRNGILPDIASPCFGPYQNVFTDGTPVREADKQSQ